MLYYSNWNMQVLNEDFVKCHVSSHMMSLLKSIELSDSRSQPAKVSTSTKYAS